MSKILQLFESRSRFVTFFVSVLILLLFYQFKWGLELFNPSYVNWVIEDTELANGFFSFGYYRHQPWQFPIGNIDKYFYPIGANLYTIDMPLLALPLKVVQSVLPEPFQYIGIWYLICHLLQAWFAILLCERFGISGLGKIFAVFFLLFTPVLLSRYLHPTLFCQWIILAGLWIYFLEPKEGSIKKILVYQFLLFIVSGLVFAYMWAMVFGFTVALFLRLWWFDKRLTLAQSAIYFGSFMLVMIAIWLSIGLFSFEGIPSYQMEGWGAFSLNLNSLYNPMGTAGLLPTQPYFWPQHLEGYAYLGAGILLLILICFVLFLRNVFLKEPPKELLKIRGISTLPIILFFLFSSIYALSNRISFGNNIIFEYPLSSIFSGIINSLRSSGRFFWPAYYFIFISLFYYLSRQRIKSWLKSVILSVCLFIQFYDLQGYFQKANIKYEDYTPPINPIWETLIKSYDNLIFYPGLRRDLINTDDYRYFAYYTVRHQKNINMGYPARFDVSKVGKQMGILNASLATEGLAENTLYVSLEPFLNSLIVPISRGEAYCFSIDDYLLIFKKTESSMQLAALLEKRGFEDQSSRLSKNAVARPWHEDTRSIAITNARSNFYEVNYSDNHLFVKGWAFNESSKTPSNDSTFLILESSRTGSKWISTLPKFGSSDVASFFNRPDLDRVGFGRSISFDNLENGSYRVGILFIDQQSLTKSLFWLDYFANVNKPARPIVLDGLFEDSINIRYDLNVVAEGLKDVSIESWAFPEDSKRRNYTPYFVLTFENLRYGFAATSVARPDVASFFKDSTLFYAGCNVKFNKDLLRKGTYKLGILFRDSVNKVNYFVETDRTINVKVEPYSNVLIYNKSAVGKDSVRAFIDAVRDSIDFVEVEGWGFIDKMSTDAIRSSIILKSERDVYEVSTIMVNRPDIKEYFGLNYNTDHAGFKVKLKKRDIRKGHYQLFLLVENLITKKQTLHDLQSSLDL